jgi:ubiquinone/menaquinone biosynthesis C-methylase UbiE
MRRILQDLRLVRRTKINEWYADVAPAWDGLSANQDGREGPGWRNLGYWADGVSTLDDAAMALAAKLATSARIAPGQLILDVGCGYGESAFRLYEQLGSNNENGAGGSAVVGLDLTENHVRAAIRRRGAADQPFFLVGDATRLPFSEASFDRVLALECAFYFPTRERFFGSALHVLRPGGLIAIADVALHPYYAKTVRALERAAPPLYRFVGDLLKEPPENLVSLGEYRRQLRDAGFVDVAVEDITEQVLTGFGRYWRKASNPARQEAALVSRGMPPAVARAHARTLRRQMNVVIWSLRMSRYLIVTARRPDETAVARTGETLGSRRDGGAFG